MTCNSPPLTAATACPSGEKRGEIQLFRADPRLPVGAVDDIKFARKRHEDFAAVFRQLKAGEPSQALALALPPALFFRGQFFFGALEQFFRRQDLAQVLSAIVNS